MQWEIIVPGNKPTHKYVKFDDDEQHDEDIVVERLIEGGFLSEGTHSDDLDISTARDQIYVSDKSSKAVLFKLVCDDVF